MPNAEPHLSQSAIDKTARKLRRIIDTVPIDSLVATLAAVAYGQADTSNMTGMYYNALIGLQADLGAAVIRYRETADRDAMYSPEVRRLRALLREAHDYNRDGNLLDGTQLHVIDMALTQ